MGGVLVGLGALGAMLAPSAMGHGIDTQSFVVAVVVVSVVLVLAYVTNPSAASFRTFLTELAFRRHLSKLHDASDAEPPSLHWARHSHQIDAAPHLQFATRASVSVCSSAHIFRSFGVLTIAAVTPVADHRTGTKHRNDHPAPANAFASDHGRWFLGAFGKWWLGGALLLGKPDDAHATAGLLDIRLLDDSELLTKWTVIPESTARRTPPPLPKHASLPLHTPTKQQKLSAPKQKPKPEASAPPTATTTSNGTTSTPNTNIDAHPLIADLLQHIATTQSTLSNTRAQLAQLNASTAHTREQTEEHIAQRAKHNSTSTVSDAAKTHTHQLTNARRTLRSSEKTLAGVQARHAALEQKAAALTEEAKLLRDRVLKDGERLKDGEEKGRVRREEVVEMIGARKEELRRIEEEIVGVGDSCPSTGEDKDGIGLAGRVRALEAEVREARKTLNELRAWQASEEAKESGVEDQGERNREIEQEKEPGVVYIGQTPVRAVSLSNGSQTNPSRIHNLVAPHTRTASGPASGLLSHTAHQTQNAPVAPASSANAVANPGYSPTPVNAPAAADVASPARSARNKGYAIFDTDLAVLGASKGIHSPIAKGANGASDTGGPSSQSSSNPSPGSTHQVATRPTFSPFDSDTLPIAIPKRTGTKYALGPDTIAKYAHTLSPDNANAKYSPVTAAKFGLSPDGFGLGLGMDSPTTGVFSPPPNTLLPSSLFSEDGHGHQRWDSEAESDGTANGQGQLVNSTSPGQLMGSQFGTSPSQFGNGTSPGRWEKDADGWVNEAKAVSQPNANSWHASKQPIANDWDTKQVNTSGWDAKPTRDSNWTNDLDGWVGGESRRRWTSESSANGMWAPRAEGGRARSASTESRFDAPIGRPRSDSHDAHRLSTGADSGYHTATNHSHPKKRHSGSSSGDDVAQDGLSFAPPFLQHSPVSVSIDSPGSSFGQGVFGPPSHLSTRRGFDAQRVSLATRVPLIREVEEPESVQPTIESVVSNSPKSRRWFPSVGAKKDDGNVRATTTAVQGSGLNPDAKVFSFSPDASKMFNFTRGRTFSMTPPAPPPAELNTASFSSLSLGSANSSSVALGNGGSSGGSGTFFSSLLAFAPSPAEREALQRALGTNGITRTLSNTSARSPFTSPLASARSSAVDLNDKAALAWGNGENSTPIVQKRTWFPVRKKAAAEETE